MMSHPTNTQIFFRPTMPHHGVPPTNIINSVPLIKPQPTMPWMQGSALATVTKQNGYASFKSIQTSTEIRPKSFQQTQAWKPYNATHPTHSTRASNVSPAVAAVNIRSNICLNEATAQTSPKANGSPRCPKMTAIKASRKKLHNLKKNEADKSNNESLQETVFRQRELIGKLISVIVKDRLKTHNTTGELGLKDGDVSEVEKILNFTGSLKSSKMSLKSDQNSASNFSSGDRKRRTRTVTGEKKHLNKRLRREKRSPKQSFNAGRPNASHNTNSVVATVSQPKNQNEQVNNKVKNSLQDAAVDPDFYDELAAAMSKKVLDLMHPGGGSRLYSLRMEFARQLKSLEDEFLIEYNKYRHGKFEADSHPKHRPLKPIQHEHVVDDVELSGDSDWLPSSVTSTSTTNKKSISLSSEPSSESYSFVKKKFPRRKHVRCYKPQQNYRHPSFRNKANNSSCFKPITPRRASGMAKQKIDQILRHPETDDTNSNADRSKKFHERALQKIRQSMALWNKMSSELSSYFLSELPKYSAEVTKIENDVINNEPDLLQKDVVNNNVHSDPKLQVADDTQRTDENLAKLPSNKTDPSFMLSKFLQFLPDHNDPKDYGSDFEDPSPHYDVEDISEDDKNIDCNNGYSENIQQDFYTEVKSKSPSHNLESQDQPCNEDDESTNQSAPFYCTLNQPEISDPDIIGEVIIVTTDENYNQLEEKNFPGVIKVEEKMEEEENDDKVNACVVPTQITACADCKSEVNVHSEEFLEKLCEDREALSPSAIADRLRQHEHSVLSCETDDDLPMINFKRQKPVVASQSRVQMFRALNSDKRTTSQPTSSPSKLSITKVVSLNEEATRSAKSASKQSAKSKKDGSKLKEKSELSECVNTVQISIAKDDEGGNNEVKTNTLMENEKVVARPLKKLISDINLNEMSGDPSVIEWGLVPRKAMHLAKQRIQKQLCGSERDDDFPSVKRESRRSSLRSSVLMTPGGDCADNESKKQERKRSASKRASCGEGDFGKLDMSSNIVTLTPSLDADEMYCLEKIM